MAFVFDATPSGAAANSWASVAEADDYFAGRRNASAWTVLDTAGKPVALVHGTRELERLSYDGSKVTSSQALKVPRSGLEDDDGYPLPFTVVPTPFKHALFEQVLFDLNQGTTDSTQLTGLEAFKSIEIDGAVALELRDGAEAPRYAPAAMQLLALYVTTMPGVTRLVRA